MKKDSIEKVIRRFTWSGFTYYLVTRQFYGFNDEYLDKIRQVAYSDYRAAKAHLKHRVLFEKMYSSNQRRATRKLNQELRNS
jgi:hypothetical protein